MKTGNRGTRIVSIIFIILVCIAAVIGLQVFFMQAVQAKEVAQEKVVSAGAELNQRVDEFLSFVKNTSFKQALQSAQNEDKVLNSLLGISPAEVDSLQEVKSGRYKRSDIASVEKTRETVVEAVKNVTPVGKNIKDTLELLKNTWKVQERWPLYLELFKTNLLASKNEEVQKLARLLDRFLTIVKNNREGSQKIVDAGFALAQTFVKMLLEDLKDASSMKVNKLSQAILSADEPIKKELRTMFEQLRLLNKDNKLVVLLDELEGIDFTKIDFNTLFAPAGLAIVV